MNDKLIAEARELCRRYEQQNDIPPSMLKKTRELANALEKAEKQIPRWIPTSERAPDGEGSYLVYYHEWSKGRFLPAYDLHRIRVMRFMTTGEWRMPVCTDKRCEEDTNREVTHWMPLPKGAEEEK